MALLPRNSTAESPTPITTGLSTAIPARRDEGAIVGATYSFETALERVFNELESHSLVNVDADSTDVARELAKLGDETNNIIRFACEVKATIRREKDLLAKDEDVVAALQRMLSGSQVHTCTDKRVLDAHGYLNSLVTEAVTAAEKRKVIIEDSYAQLERKRISATEIMETRRKLWYTRAFQLLKNLEAERHDLEEEGRALLSEISKE